MKWRYVPRQRKAAHDKAKGAIWLIREAVDMYERGYHRSDVSAVLGAVVARRALESWTPATKLYRR